MKPENKLPVLDLISAEMKTVVNTLPYVTMLLPYLLKLLVSLV